LACMVKEKYTIIEISKKRFLQCKQNKK